MPRMKINTKSYKTIPQHHQNIDPDQYVTTPDWLEQFVQLCLPITIEQLNAHIGANSLYRSKNELLRALKFHYAVLSGALKEINSAFDISQDQKAAMITKINEDIGECSPGYHARINSLLTSYFLPKTVAELLKLVRYNIVERAANKVTNEVHANNRFFIIAKQMGFGVEPKLANDPYVGAISHTQIATDLNKAFEENFQPFSMLLQLKELIIPAFDQYAGRKAEYKAAMYMPGLEYLRNLFQEAAIDYDYLITDEETGAVCDINWNLILDKLWNILLAENYFSCFSVSKIFSKTWGLRSLSKYVKTHTDDALAAVSPIFRDPANASTEDLEKMHHLFRNSAECFAYLYCNPDLTEDDKLTVLFSTLASKRPDYREIKRISDDFWGFAFDNPKLTDAFGKEYVEQYPVLMEDFEHNLNASYSYFRQQVSNPEKIKVFSLKLKYLPRDAIGPILTREPSNLYWAISGCRSQPQLMLSFIQLMSSVGGLDRGRILAYEHYDGNNILSLALSGMSKSHVDAAHQLLNMITVLPNADKLSILQLSVQHQYQLSMNHNNPLLKAINHCPALVPSLLNLILTLDYRSQNRLISYCLSHPSLKNEKRLCFKRLLELNQRVNSLANQPNKKEAYEAAQQLQTTLINSLNEYLEDREQPNASSKLKNTWDEAILKASPHLSVLSDWPTVFKNLSLALVSIPLLGIPLVVNYYCSGYKRVFFLPQQAQGLEHLSEVMDQESLLLNKI